MRTYGRLSVSRTRLVEILSGRRGEAQAVTGDELAMLLHAKEEDNRSLREAIQELLRDGHPIGSSTKAGGGYYWIVTEDELQKNIAAHRSRIREHEANIRALEAGFRRGVSQPALLS